MDLFMGQIQKEDKTKDCHDPGYYVGRIRDHDRCRCKEQTDEQGRLNVSGYLEKEQVHDPYQDDKRQRGKQNKCSFYVSPEQVRSFGNEDVIQREPGIAVIKIYGNNMP